MELKTWADRVAPVSRRFRVYGKLAGGIQLNPATCVDMADTLDTMAHLMDIEDMQRTRFRQLAVETLKCLAVIAVLVLMAVLHG